MNTKSKPWLAHYDAGVPVEIEIPDITLIELFSNAVAENGESTCIIYEGQTLTLYL